MKLAHRLFHPGERLSQRVIHAGFWAFALRITDWFVRSSAGSPGSPGLEIVRTAWEWRRPYRR